MLPLVTLNKKLSKKSLSAPRQKRFLGDFIVFLIPESEFRSFVFNVRYSFNFSQHGGRGAF